MTIKSIILMSLLPLSAMAANNDKNFTINLSDLSSYKFQQVEQGLLRHEDSEKIIEIASGSYAVEKELENLENQLSDLHTNNFKAYEYEYEYNKLLDAIESFQLELAYLSQDSQQHKVSGSSTNTSCPMSLTQTYVSSPMMWGVGLRVTSNYPQGPGPIPPQHPVDIQAFSIVYPGESYQKLTVNEFTGGHTTGGSTSAFQASGYTGSGAIVPFKAISTLRDRSFMGIFGCYTTISVYLDIPSSY